MTRNHRLKHSNGILNADNRADFCGGPGIQSLEMDESANFNGLLMIIYFDMSGINIILS